MSSSGSSSAPSDKELPSSGAKSSGSGHARPGHQDEQGERRPVTTAAALSHEGGHDSPTVQARMSRVNLVCCALLVLLVPGLLGSALTLIALPSCLNRKEESDATGTVAAIPCVPKPTGHQAPATPATTPATTASSSSTPSSSTPSSSTPSSSTPSSSTPSSTTPSSAINAGTRVASALLGTDTAACWQRRYVA
ncbi:nuclear pore complex protein DDB_G0274915-like [Dermacentor silvarum]|uniref:nuclear pore complex protein DDB_G0274915-like n=1 Tax=Dermacentor silvarum TaxID=543639 RepID=UPI002100E158|nr:nuclear pore complex protein DDB_G0274915-like [Dermacentor silvarum]